MKQSRWLCVIMILLFVSGCTMLTSKGIDEKTHWPITNGGIQYSLPKALIAIKLAENNGNLRITIEQPTFVADPEHTYLLRYKTSPFASDKFDVQVDPKTGLMTKIDMTADDQLDEIIVEIAKAVAMLESADVTGDTVLIERIVDPTDDSALLALETEFNKIGRDSICKDPNITTCDGPGIKFIMKKPYTDEKIISNKTRVSDCNVGVCYRNSMPYVFGFSFGNSITYETIVNLPNEAPVIALNLDRTLFVSRVNTIEFENGMLEKVYIDKPSEGLELARLPVEVAKGILSAPAEILKLKIDLSDQEEAWANQQVALIDAEKALREKQAEAKAKESSEASKPLPLLSGTSNGLTLKQGLKQNTQTNDNGVSGGQVDWGSQGTMPPKGIQP